MDSNGPTQTPTEEARLFLFSPCHARYFLLFVATLCSRVVHYLRPSRSPLLSSVTSFHFPGQKKKSPVGGRGNPTPPPHTRPVFQKVDLLSQTPSSPDIFCRSWALVGDSDRLGGRFWSFRGVRSGFDALVHDSNRRSHQALRSQLGSVASQSLATVSHALARGRGSVGKRERR